MDKKSFSLLVCPITRTTLTYDKKSQELISKKANLAFPIINDIPIMLVERARKID